MSSHRTSRIARLVAPVVAVLALGAVGIPAASADTFTATTMFSLTTVVNGSGTIVGNTGTNSYAQGSLIILTAIPDAGWEFSSWSGDCAGQPLSTVVPMTAAKSCTANFTQIAVPTPTTPSSGGTTKKVPKTIKTGF